MTQARQPVSNVVIFSTATVREMPSALRIALSLFAIVVLAFCAVPSGFNPVLAMDEYSRSALLKSRDALLEQKHSIEAAIALTREKIAALDQQISRLEAYLREVESDLRDVENALKR